MADIAFNVANIHGSNLAVRRREYLLGETGVQGDIVYRDANNQWKKVDQNAPLGANVTDEVGMLETAGNANQPATVIVEDPNLSVGGTLLTNGTAVYASVNAGKATHDVPGAGNYSIFLGLPRSQGTMNFKPVAGGVTV